MNMRARHQLGVSLISTMVGLLMGMVAIVGVMSVYKVLIYRGGDIRMAAKQEAQVQASMMTVQMDILSAGYGVEADTNSCLGVGKPGPSASANKDLILIANASLPDSDHGNDEGGGDKHGRSHSLGNHATHQTIGNSAVAGNALVWHTKIGGVERCAGLIATDGGLFKLTSRTNCSDATDWDQLAWTTESLIAKNTLKEKTTSAGAAVDDAVSINVRKVASCSPFGSIPVTSAVAVVLSMGHSMATDARATATICLPNICQ